MWDRIKQEAEKTKDKLKAQQNQTFHLDLEGELSRRMN